MDSRATFRVDTGFYIGTYRDYIVGPTQVLVYDADPFGVQEILKLMPTENEPAAKLMSGLLYVTWRSRVFIAGFITVDIIHL